MNENSIRALLSDNMEDTRNWVEEQLDLLARLEYGDGAYTEEVEYEDGMAMANVFERGCHCCSDDCVGDVTLDADQLVELLTTDVPMKERVEEAKKVEAKRINDERLARERKIKAEREAKDLMEYKRLQEKFNGTK